jgi:hypothetical protein
MTDEGDPQRTAREEQHERAEIVENILREVNSHLDEESYPVRREELSARYGETTVELPNETEALGDVFDRLTDQEFDTPREAKEAVIHEVTGKAIDPGEFNLERDLEPDEAGDLGSTEDQLEAAEESPVDTEPRNDPEAIPEETEEAPEGVYEGAESVEDIDREDETEETEDITDERP